MKTKTTLPLVEGLTFLLLATFFLLPFLKVLGMPNNYLFQTQSDGYKNYLGLAWYLDHDSGLNFTGFNYPFGFHYLLTDGHVPLGIILKMFGASGAYAVGIINLCMVLSLPFSAWLYYRLFRRFGLEWAYAVMLGASLILLSPQWPRLNGHYALSYMWCFPALYLLILSIRANGPWQWRVPAVAAVQFFCYLLHPYLGLLTSLLTAVLLLDQISNWRSVQVWLKWAVAVVIPIVGFQLCMLEAEPYTAPGNRPWGFWDYQSGWDAYWWPHDADARGFLKYKLGLRARIVPEGRAFFGWFNLGVLAAAVYLSIRWRKVKRPFLLILGVLAFLLSIGVPFDQSRFFYDIAGPFREFRTLGRLSWLAIFGLTMWAFITVVPAIRNQKWGGAIPLLVLVMAMLESDYYRWRVIDTFTHTEGLTHEVSAALPPLHGDFVSVISYPFSYLGCDQFGAPNYDKMLLVQALRTAVATGIPAGTNASSRLHPTMAAAICSVSSPLGVAPALRERLPDAGDFLVVCRPNHADKLHRINGSVVLAETEDWHYFQIPLPAYLDAHLDPVFKQRADALSEPLVTFEEARPWEHPTGIALTEPGHYDLLMGHRSRPGVALPATLWIERVADKEQLAYSPFTEAYGYNAEGFQITRLEADLHPDDFPCKVLIGFDPQYPGFIEVLKPDVVYTPFSAEGDSVSVH